MTLNTTETREENVRVAEHNGEMEGQHITPETKSDAQKYIAGVIDSEELVERALSRYGLK